MEDERIIELYFERNENAIKETALKYGRMLRALAYGILKNRGMRERYLPHRLEQNTACTAAVFCRVFGAHRAERFLR